MSDLREYAIAAYFRIFLPHISRLHHYMVRIFWKKCPRFSDMPWCLAAALCSSAAQVTYYILCQIVCVYALHIAAAAAGCDCEWVWITLQLAERDISCVIVFIVWQNRTEYNVTVRSSIERCLSVCLARPRRAHGRADNAVHVEFRAVRRPFCSSGRKRKITN